MTRLQKRQTKIIDVAKYLVWAKLPTVDDERDAVVRALEWPEGGSVILWRARISDEGGVKPSEVVQALVGTVPPGTRYARLALVEQSAAPA